MEWLDREKPHWLLIFLGCAKSKLIKLDVNVNCAYLHKTEYLYSHSKYIHRKQKGTIKAFDKFYSWFPAFLDMFPDEEAFLTFAFWFVIATVAVAFVASRYIKIKPHHL